MKKLKLDFQQLNAEVLTRSQLKQILGGKVDGSVHPDACSSGPCTVYDNGQTYSGTCGLYDMGGGLYVCECETALGFYNPTGGTSHCNV